ncbi:MAG TPA: fibronectin type III domain-containing protein [Catenuloplanes sp.]|jgi:hypothetical protein
MRTARPISRPVAALLLLVLLAGGCDLPGSGAAGRPTATPKPSSTDSWVVTAGGGPSASPSTRSVASPSPAPTPARPAPAQEPPATAPPACSGTSRPGQLNGLTVVPGAGSATVSWYHAGDPAVVRYRLAAVPQKLAAGSQSPLDWRDVPTGAPCRTVTSTITGLTPGAPYIFWLDAVSTARVGAGDRDIAVGRSGVVTVG